MQTRTPRSRCKFGADLLATSAAALSDAEGVVATVAATLGQASPRTSYTCLIFRDHPALEIAVSARWHRGEVSDQRGLHLPFAQSPSKFDRWSVEAGQRNRWCPILQWSPSSLTDYWANGIGRPPTFRRIILCDHAKPLAYVSASLEDGSQWSTTELRRIGTSYRKLSSALRIAALGWRARHRPADWSASLVGDAEAAVVVNGQGEVLASSPTARRWLRRDAELQAVLQQGQAMGDGRHRIGAADLRVSTLAGPKGLTWKLARYSRRRGAPQAQLDEVALPELSPRELELCEWLVTGLTNAAIARRMDLRPSTVKTMLERLYWRRGVSGRVQLVQRLLLTAVQRGGQAERSL